MLLVGFQDGKRCAEVSIDKMTIDEVAAILEIWEDLGREWEYAIPARMIKTYKWPSFDEGKEVER